VVEFQRALELDPGFAPARLDLGNGRAAAPHMGAALGD